MSGRSGMSESSNRTEPRPATAWRSFDTLPRAHGEPPIRCRLRAAPEDFVVDELLAFGADGEGEHCLLRVRKTGVNTDWAAQRLARCAGVSAKVVGYAGLKDRHAVTTQWFSVHLGPRPEPDWRPCLEDGIEVLESHRHRRKLRRGVLAGNRFQLRLREVAGDLDALASRVDSVAERGVPNYYGPQRFGRDEGNLYQADALFGGGTGAATGGRRGGARRHVRGLWLSAARSQLFNELLARRVERGDWCIALPGERLQLFGSHSHFLAAELDDDIRARVAAGDLQPTGPLLGAGEPLAAGTAGELEAAVAADFPRWVEGLAAAGLRQERRPLRLVPEDLRATRVDAGDVVLRFTLPPGCYATSLLRELAHWWE